MPGAPRTKSLSDGITFENTTMQRTGRMVQLLRSQGSGPPPDSVRRWMDVAGLSTIWRPVTGTLLALMQTGDINLVRDDSLRIAIVEYTSMIDGVTEELSNQNSEFLARATLQRERIEPYLIHGPQTWQDTARASAIGPGGASDLQGISFNLEGMRRDAALRSTYLNVLISNSNFRAKIAAARDETEALLKRLEHMR